MNLVVLGSSGTFPAPENPASGYLVSAGGTRIWCDAGPGTFAALAGRMPPEELSAVVLSHMHADHCSDLLSLVHYLAYGTPGGTVAIDVHGPEDAAERFESFLRPRPGHPFFEVLRFHHAAPGTGLRVGDVRLDFAAAVHSVPAVLTRLSADGRRLAYTGDTGPAPHLAEFAAGADVLVAEASLGPDDDPYPHHMTPAEAGEAAAAAGVGILVLTHLRPTLDAAVAVAAAAETFGREPLVAAPGMELEF